MANIAAAVPFSGSQVRTHIRSPFRERTLASDLPSFIPNVPVFDGESSFDAAKVGQDFLRRLSAAVKDQDWAGFADLFIDNCFWKDALTLTFDKRTLAGKKDIVNAWMLTHATRRPIIHTTKKNYGLNLPIAFNRASPTLATLDVPFCLSTEQPKSNCVGLAKLVPQEDGSWRIWVMSTLFVSLVEHPFKKLPRTSESVVPTWQKGHSKSQGLPHLQEGIVLDAVVIGASTVGVANTITLESLGLNVVAFDTIEQAGGNWSREGRNYVILHHLASIVSLPQYPVPSHYPDDLGGKFITQYISEAVEALKLPVFCGVKVISNTYDDSTGIWDVLIEDVKMGIQAQVQTRNLVLCMGSIFSQDNLYMPDLPNRSLFKGTVEHSAEYMDAGPYKGKNVLIVGAGNSAHDVARNLAEGGVGKVTILQRGATAFFEWEKIRPLLEGPYLHGHDLRTADFLFQMMPLGIGRDLARGAMAAIEASQAELYAKLESKGYSVQRRRDFVTQTYETRNGSFFRDRQKTLELVFNDQIKVTRGAAKQFAEHGLVVYDKATGNERLVEADGIILATGFKDVDMPRVWAQNGFLKSKWWSMLENPGSLNLDQEGELAGLFTDSGRAYFLFVHKSCC